jgi:hypothetical protein
VKTVSTSVNTFFLIDGLDEFGGRSQDIINFVRSLQGPWVKICVSSRPWPLFEDAFTQSPSLRMEYLTHHDIRVFVAAKLNQNPGFQALQDCDKEGTRSLIQEVVKKANGVFLWVSLVVELLVEALSNGEPLSDLRRHVESLPSDLTSLFDRILNNLQIDSTKFKRSSELFQIVMAATEPIRVLQLSFALESDPEYAFNLPIKPLATREEKSRAELVRRRVSAYSKCLFEIRRKRYVPLAHCQVEVIHRTVNDYLHTPQVWNRFTQITDRDFDPVLQLSLAQIAKIKTMPPSIRWGSAVEHFDEPLVGDHIIYKNITQAVSYVKGIEGLDFHTLDRLMQEINRAAAELTGYGSIARAAIEHTNSSTLKRKRMKWPCLHPVCQDKAAILYLAHDNGLETYATKCITDLDGSCRELYKNAIVEYKRPGSDSSDWFDGPAWENEVPVDRIESLETEIAVYIPTYDMEPAVSKRKKNRLGTLFGVTKYLSIFFCRKGSKDGD